MELFLGYVRPWERCLEWCVLGFGVLVIVLVSLKAYRFFRLKGELSWRLAWNFVGESQGACITVCFATLAVFDLLQFVPSWVQSCFRLWLFSWAYVTSAKIYNHYFLREGEG
jgi:hypothetical protein